jgi:hypothetical protein
LECLAAEDYTRGVFQPGLLHNSSLRRHRIGRRKVGFLQHGSVGAVVCHANTVEEWVVGREKTLLHAHRVWVELTTLLQQHCLVVPRSLGLYQRR